MAKEGFTDGSPGLRFTKAVGDDVPSSMQQHLVEALQGPGAPSRLQIDQMAVHWTLLLQWNARINLTAITDAATAARLHYQDSLQGLAHVPGGPVVDFGSGAGFPGLILAVMRPQWAFTLVEPRQKRASFLQVAAAALQLPNVTVLRARLEDSPDRRYASAVTRATFSDAASFAQAAAWLQPGGVLLAYRAAGAELPAEQGRVTSHAYWVGDRQRRIDVWTFS